MDPTTDIECGLPARAALTGKTGREILQAIVDGKLPAHGTSAIMDLAGAK